MRFVVPVIAPIRRKPCLGVAAVAFETPDLADADAPVVLRVLDAACVARPTEMRSWNGRLWRPIPERELERIVDYRRTGDPGSLHDQLKLYTVGAHPLGSTRKDIQDLYNSRLIHMVDPSEASVMASPHHAAMRVRASMIVAIDGVAHLMTEGPMITLDAPDRAAPRNWVAYASANLRPFGVMFARSGAIDFRDADLVERMAQDAGARVAYAQNRVVVDVVGDLPEPGFDFAASNLEGSLRLAWSMVAGRRLKDLDADEAGLLRTMRDLLVKRTPGAGAFDDDRLKHWFGEVDRQDIEPFDEAIAPLEAFEAIELRGPHQVYYRDRIRTAVAYAKALRDRRVSAENLAEDADALDLGSVSP